MLTATSQQLCVAYAILKRTVEDDNHGYTYWTTIAKPHNGYAVAIEQHSVTITNASVDFLTAKVVADYITTHFSDAAGIGLWYDRGVLYLDTVWRIPDLETAISVAHGERQLAIYDIENDCVIDLTVENL